jgi:hypothetical protein
MASWRVPPPKRRRYLVLHGSVVQKERVPPVSGGLRSGAMVLGYKQEEYISYSLRCLAPFCDHVVVMYSEAPWIVSNPMAREHFGTPDRTREILDALCSEHPNIQVVEGVWDSAPQVRQAALRRLRRLGVEVCLITDADEIYPDGMVERLLAHIDRRSHPGAVYYARYMTCYRRFDYVVESDHRMSIAVHLDETTEFRQLPRRPTGVHLDLPDDIYYWHMGYVLSDERMWEKIHTISHAHEVLPDWYESKWLKWSPDETDLFRKEPASRWGSTVRIDPRALPKVLHDHPYFPSGPAETRHRDEPG